MQQTSQIEAILQCWGIDAIANWQAIQDNIARITLADGDELVLKALGPSDAAKTARLHFEHDVLCHVAQAECPWPCPCARTGARLMSSITTTSIAFPIGCQTGLSIHRPTKNACASIETTVQLSVIFIRR